MAKKQIQRDINVLVIDDDVDVCRYLERFLTDQGFVVKYTTEASGVVETIKQDMIQIVLLDVVMPDVDGLELLQKIRRVDSDICIIMLSGYPTFDRAVEAFRSSVFDFLTKPFTNEQLMEVLERAIKAYGFRTDLNERAIKQIAAEVRRLRAGQKLSLRQLASRTGLSPSLIYQIEHAHTAPSLATVSRLATALKAPLEQLFKGL
ncbi:response regulator [candidate division GN15 bacterium]|nr:response regulator [candidate division GN15 bacterium]